MKDHSDCSLYSSRDVVIKILKVFLTTAAPHQRLALKPVILSSSETVHKQKSKI